MGKTAKRTFLDRALEGLKDKFPGERPTQVKLAKIAGVTQPTVHEWGEPDRGPEIPTAKRLAEELNLCVEWLYTERGPKNPPPTPTAEPYAAILANLDPAIREEVARYAEFLKGTTNRQ